MRAVPKESNTSGLDFDAVGIDISNPATKLDIAGGLKVGTPSSTACLADQKGTLAFFEKDPYTLAVVNTVYLCNGTKWETFK